MDFWHKLPKPFFVLAPLADVTDAAFRRVIAKYSKPHKKEQNVQHPDVAQKGGPAVMFTEFVSADGLVLAPEEGRKKLLADLIYSETERPIVAQFFTGKPEMMEKVAALAHELGFDGVDINMGCPDKSIEKQKAGAAMIKNPALAKEVIAAAIQGAKGLPVSVKTRIGYNKNEIETWVPELLSTGISALIIHARTRKEMSAVPAQWEKVKRTVELRNELNPNVLILGNGDVKDLDDAREKANESGADGVMLGRAIFGNPWLFGGSTPTLEERLNVLAEHTKLYEELLPHKSFAIMKKHYKAYVTGFDGAAELRADLMSAENAEGIADIVAKFLDKTPTGV